MENVGLADGILKMTDQPIPSKTYKITLPDDISTHAVYFTIVGQPEKPEMFFVNSKEMESFQWIVSLMTALSRQMEAGISIQNIINDMVETFDPGGAYFLEDGSGRQVHSVVHHLGLVLEHHVNNPMEEQADVTVQEIT